MLVSAKENMITRIYILLTSISLLFSLNCRNYSTNDNYRITETLEELINNKNCLTGTEYSSIAPRTTEIRKRLPANITWFDKTWSWEKIDFKKFWGGVVGAIFTQATKHDKILQKKGFTLVGADFFARPSYPNIRKPKYVGWYRKSRLKYNSESQIDIKQDPIDSGAEKIIYRRSYIYKKSGVLFITYRYIQKKKYLNMELMYSDFNNDFKRFDEYHFKEKLITK